MTRRAPVTDIAGYERLDRLGRDLHDRFDHVSLAAMCADLLATVNRVADTVHVFKVRNNAEDTPSSGEAIAAVADALSPGRSPRKERSI